MPSQRIMREGVETRNGAPTKRCSECSREKPLNEFYKKDHTGRRDGRCKACRIIRQRERNLGVSHDKYWELYQVQKGKCGICNRRLYSKRYKRFCVDHDHDTGRIRGLLCHNCNRAIGMLRDNPDALERAVEWVKR